MSEHREHLLPDTEDISCRGALIVGLHAGMRQRIYLCCGAGDNAAPARCRLQLKLRPRPVQGVPGRRSTARAPATAAHRIDNLFRSLPGAWGSVILGLSGDGLATPRGWRSYGRRSHPPICMSAESAAKVGGAAPKDRYERELVLIRSSVRCQAKTADLLPPRTRVTGGSAGARFVLRSATTSRLRPFILARCRLPGQRSGLPGDLCSPTVSRSGPGSPCRRSRMRGPKVGCRRRRWPQGRAGAVVHECAGQAGDRVRDFPAGGGTITSVASWLQGGDPDERPGQMEPRR